MKRNNNPLKKATRDLIDLCGGIKHAAKIPNIRIGNTQLFNYTDPNNYRSFIPVDQALYLESYCNTQLITSTMHILYYQNIQKTRQIEHELNKMDVQMRLCTKIINTTCKILDSRCKNEIINSARDIISCARTITMYQEI